MESISPYGTTPKILDFAFTWALIFSCNQHVENILKNNKLKSVYQMRWEIKFVSFSFHCHVNLRESRILPVFVEAKDCFWNMQNIERIYIFSAYSQV